MRIALITGASGVIGGACAKALGEKGYALALQYHDHPERAQALVKTLPEDTPVLLCHADITRENDVTALFKAIEQRMGRVDLLVNCAGVAGRSERSGDGQALFRQRKGRYAPHKRSYPSYAEEGGRRYRPSLLHVGAHRRCM